MQTTFTIKSITTTHSDQVLTLVANEFSSGSPLHQAMNIRPHEYREYLSKDWQSTLFDGPVDSLGAFCDSNQELLGCLIATRFPVTFDNIELLPEKHRPIAALLQTLEQQYLQQYPQQHLQHKSTVKRSLLVDLAVVRHSHHGSGIYQQLRTTLHQIAASAGFETVFGELSSSKTKHVCIQKMQHQVVAEINYRDFRYGAKAPFAMIEDPYSIQLVSTNTE